MAKLFFSESAASMAANKLGFVDWFLDEIDGHRAFHGRTAGRNIAMVRSRTMTGSSMPSSPSRAKSSRPSIPGHL